MDELDVFGIPVPDAGPVFFAALGVHVAAGLCCVGCGAVAALSLKGGAWHVRSGRIYLWGLGVVWASMAVLSVIRWRENAGLFAVGTLALAAALAGYTMRRRRPALHIAGMGASYIALLTGFYLDNGPHLPLWERLPGWSHGALPSLVGAPLIALTLWRRRPTRTAKKVTS
ncbi:hypothetical protein Misp01_58380 [Microtetraspora sp. NBRC 13810]|uniref:hypothetical protein n=1 Tax=Microtetraspora sp. NBRC 13810 TaxID=3030990 RepID=UPI0024A14E42|nr:hypothetical protein [Microtetraspora sp. NBRC 13810]GLW10710.1 hypothetical protein Misp01_58380 [Microtetraspora sp. NBRC 13810]